MTQHQPEVAGRLPPNFSWVTESVAGSAHPGYGAGELERSLAAFREAGVGCLVSLAPVDRARVEGAGIASLVLVTPDMAVPDPAALDRAVAAVQEHLAAGRKVVVHCGAGYGRTGLFLACLLVAEGRAAEEAIACVRRARPGSIETGGQEAFVRKWAARRRAG